MNTTNSQPNRVAWRMTSVVALGAAATFGVAACGDDDEPDDTEVEVNTSEVTGSSVVSVDSEVTVGTTVTSEVEVVETVTDVSEVVVTGGD